MKKLLKRYKKKVKVFYWKIRGETIDPDEGTLLPNFGRGKYVDVLKKGGWIDIIDHAKGFIRIIPDQNSHGVKIELWGTYRELKARSGMSYDDFIKYLNRCGEVE